MTEKHSDRFSIPNDTDCEGVEILSVNVLKLQKAKAAGQVLTSFSSRLSDLLLICENIWNFSKFPVFLNFNELHSEEPVSLSLAHFEWWCTIHVCQQSQREWKLHEFHFQFCIFSWQKFSGNEILIYALKFCTIILDAGCCRGLTSDGTLSSSSSSEVWINPNGGESSKDS